MTEKQFDRQLQDIHRDILECILEEKMNAKSYTRLVYSSMEYCVKKPFSFVSKRIRYMITAWWKSSR